MPGTTIDYTSGLPPELSEKARRLAQQQAIAQAMLQQGMSPLESPPPSSMFATKQSPFAGINKMLQTYVGAKGTGDVNAGYADLGREYNSGMQNAVKAYMARRNGGATVTPPPFANDDEGNAFQPSVAATQGDPMGAAASGMASGFAPVKELAKADLKTQEGLPAALLRMRSLDPQSLVLVTQLVSQGVPLAQALAYAKPKSETRSVGNSVVDVTDPQNPRETGYFGPQATPTGASAGQPRPNPLQAAVQSVSSNTQPNAAPQLDQQTGLPQGSIRQPNDPPGVFRLAGADGQLEPYQIQYKGDKIVGYKKMDNAPNVRITTETRYPNKWADEQARLLGKKAEEGHAKALEGRNDLILIQNAANAFNEGIKTGSFMGARNSIDRFLQTAGMKGPDGSIANTDVFMRLMAGRLLQHTKELRPMSDTDRELLMDIHAGKSLDENGLRKLLEIGIENGAKNIQFHNNWLKEKVSGMRGTEPGFVDAYRVDLPTNERGEFRIPLTGTPQPQPQGTLRPYGG